MKLLKTVISGLTLYKGDLEIDLTASQRINADARYQLNEITHKVFTNPVIELAGINASGKSMTLKVIKLVFSILNGVSLNSLPDKELYLELVGEEPITVRSFYFWKNNFYFLQTKIRCRESKKNPAESEELWICEESLYKSRTNAVVTKNNWAIEPENAKTIYALKTDREKAGDFLSGDVSINVSMVNNETKPVTYCDFLGTVNHNYLKVVGDYLPDILNFLDPNIEYLKTEKTEETNRYKWLLKFKNRDKVFHLNSPSELEFYLSSGTIKGIGIFSMSIAMFMEGGYLLADELENHFNLKIVECLLDLFMSRRVNRNGGTILFSTHYPELLDIPSRNDSIYILSNQGKISCSSLKDLKIRNDGIKTSKAFIQNLLNTITAPSYRSYISLKKVIEKMKITYNSSEEKENDVSD